MTGRFTRHGAWVIGLCAMGASLWVSASASAQEGRFGSRRDEVREANEAVRAARRQGVCGDRIGRVRRALAQLEAASTSADRSQRRRLHEAREGLHDCLYDHSNAGAAARQPSGPTVVTVPAAPRPPPGPALPVIVTHTNGSLVTSGPVVADLRARANEVRGCVASAPQNISSPFRMTITLQANGRYGGLRIPANATPGLVQCMARTVPMWRVAGRATTGAYRVEIHLTPPRASSTQAATSRTPSRTPTPQRPPQRRPPAAAMPPQPSGGAAVQVMNAQNQVITSGVVLQDAQRRVADFQRCASQNPGNVPRLFQLTITLNASGQLVSVRLPAGLDVNFEGCLSAHTARWRVSGAGPTDAGLYAITMRLR